MTTSLDSNALAALWDPDPEINEAGQASLDAALSRGSLVISACVFAELLAGPGRTEAFLDEFLQRTGIHVEWEMGERVWRTAGLAYQAYAARRKRQGGTGGPRRILTDFIIGAHAQERGYALLTLDDRLFRASFPKLRVITF